MITEQKTSQSKKNNIMRTIRIDKVTLNLGTGANQENLEKALTLLERLTGRKPVKTLSKKRIAAWKIRLGLPIGAKVTVRGKDALILLKRLLVSVSNEILENSFTENGFSFGVKEYIDVPDMKYDPNIGIIGFDVCVTLTRPGFHVKLRKIAKNNISKKHKITKQDAIDFAINELGVKLKGER